MEQNGAQSQVAIVILFQNDLQVIKCDRHRTMAEIRKMWQDATGLPISVSFAHGDRHMPDDLTVAEVLTNPSSRSFEVRAISKFKFKIQVFGFEESNTEFEVAPDLTPAAVRRDIERAVDIYTDDFRLTCDGAELDQELPFNQQGLQEGAQLIVDLRVIVKVKFEENDETKTLECYCSDSVGDLRKRLSCDDNTALVSAMRDRHVFEDSLHLCHIVSDVIDLQIPIHLTAEQKVLLTFEPITFEHLRQKLPVALSCTPLDIYDLLSERFQLTTEFRLAVHGQHLDNCKPLLEQLIDTDDIVQIDILRPFVVSDMWKSITDKDSIELVYLYSTENSFALYLRDGLSNQRLYYDEISLTIFGSVVDVFGAITGTEKPLMLVDRDVQRNFPMLTFDGVVRRLGWARDMMIDVVPTTGGLSPKEIMCRGHLLPAMSTLSDLRMTEDTLVITDPERVFISSDKKLRICRCAHGTTYGDVRKRMRQLKGCLDIGLKIRNWKGPQPFDWKLPDDAMSRKLDRELLFLCSDTRFKTQMTVTMNNRLFSCRFEPQQVSFSDVMIEVGKQSKIMPRCLFSKKLFCCGCRRQLSQEEEPHQAIPAACCSVRSLQLTDRQTKDVGTQSAGSRRRDAETFTSNVQEKDVRIPTFGEMKDVCLGTELAYKTATINSSSHVESVATAPPLSKHLRIQILAPSCASAERFLSVSGDDGQALLVATKRLLSKGSLGDSFVIFSEEVTYNRSGEERIAVRCFDQKTGNRSYIDVKDGESEDRASRICTFRRCFRPSSPLPCSPGLPLFLSVNTEVDFMSISPKRQLQAAPPSALSDPSFVVWLRGVRSGKKNFWKLAHGSWRIANAESGKVIMITDVPSGSNRFFFVMLRDKDPVPHAKVPEYHSLEVRQRAGLHLEMKKGCVRCVGPAQPADMDLWRTPGNEFVRDFTTAACK